jgi:DNA-binding transcriptional ArsR family regulator
MEPENGDVDGAVWQIAATIGALARLRILLSLLDGQPKASAQLAAMVGLRPATASAHLHQLEAANLVSAHDEGNHRFYRLRSVHVANLLERIGALDGMPIENVAAPKDSVWAARLCYDHIGGGLGVALHGRMADLGWMQAATPRASGIYELSATGIERIGALGIDVARIRGLRRRLAYGCLDWRQGDVHLGGALGAALMDLARARKWIASTARRRVLRITPRGRREMTELFALSE